MALKEGIPEARLALFDALWAMGPSEDDDELMNILSGTGMDESADALWRKGLAYYYGRGVPEDRILGRELMEAAASKDEKWESELKSMGIRCLPERPKSIVRMEQEIPWRLRRRAGFIQAPVLYGESIRITRLK
jgi:hypothetical protein